MKIIGIFLALFLFFGCGGSKDKEKSRTTTTGEVTQIQQNTQDIQIQNTQGMEICIFGKSFFDQCVFE